MPLTKCPTCDKEVSDQAAACPHCGHPLVKAQQPIVRKPQIFSIGCLGLVVIAAIAAYLFSRNETRNQPPPVSLPDQENQFCSIINAAASAYNSLSERWDTAHSQRNGIVETQITRDMTMIYRTRNADAFHAVEQRKFDFDNWVVNIIRVRTPDQHWTDYLRAAVIFEVHPVCSPLLKIHAATAATQTNVDLLSQKRQGDSLIVSGMFLQRWSGPTTATLPPMPSSPDEFEGSFTEFWFNE